MLWFDKQAKQLARLEQKFKEGEHAYEEANSSKELTMQARVFELHTKKYQGGHRPGGLSAEEACRISSPGQFSRDGEAS